jgi:hypothetical protein
LNKNIKKIFAIFRMRQTPENAFDGKWFPEK